MLARAATTPHQEGKFRWARRRVGPEHVAHIARGASADPTEARNGKNGIVLGVSDEWH
jgi:hypothetical protein